MLYIGIDPGKGGGIGVLGLPGGPFALKMAETERDLLDGLLALHDEDGTGIQDGIPCRAVIERVSAWPKMGVVSAFTFGRGYGSLLMALTACRIPFDIVTPQTWQKAMGCLSGGDKNVTKRRAQQLFPGLTVTHATADALLIAAFCRYTHVRGLVFHKDAFASAMKPLETSIAAPTGNSAAGESERSGVGRAVESIGRNAHPKEEVSGEKEGRRYQAETVAILRRQRKNSQRILEAFDKEGAQAQRTQPAPAGDGAGAKRAARPHLRGHRRRA